MTTHKFQGRVIDRATGEGVEGARVEGLDVRNVVREIVCAAPTAADGSFFVEVDDEDLALLFGKALPILAFRVIDLVSGVEVVRAVTDRSLRWLARSEGKGDLEIDRSRVAGRPAGRQPYVVDALFVNDDGAPISNASVTVSDVDLSAGGTTVTVLTNLVNGSTTTNTDARGRARISYQPIVGGVLKPQPRLKVTATRAALTSEATICRAKPRERITLVPAGGEYAGPTAYARVSEAVNATRGPAPLASLTEEQIDVLACRGKIERREVAQLAAAAKMNAAVTGVGIEAFFGMVRGGLPDNLPDLALHRLHHIRVALEGSKRRRDVGSGLDVEAAIAALKPALVDQLFEPRTDGKVPSGVIAAQTHLPGAGGGGPSALEIQQAFVGVILEHEGDQESFWTAVAADSVAGPHVERFRLTSEAAPLVSSHTPMIAHLSTKHGPGLDLENHRALARYSQQAWLDIIKPTAQGGQGIGRPASFATDQLYASAIVTAVEQRFRTRFAAWRIKDDPSGDPDMKAFFFNGNLEKNAAFELGGIRASRYFTEADVADPTWSSGISDLPAFKENLKRMQRLYAFSANYAQQKVLDDAQITCASHFHSLGPVAAHAQFDSLLGSLAVDSLLATTCGIQATTIALYANYGGAMNGFGTKAFPDMGKASIDLPPTIADWKTLFGSLDACACEHCQSVYGPAAYLVELLRFLRRQYVSATVNGLTKLHDLRPDIELLALDCKNAETPIPAIDLINEVLEVKTADFLVAPDPQLPAKVEIIREADELLGAPETPFPAHFALTYRYLAGELIAPNELVAYPPKSVFHLWNEESRILLEHLGVPRHQLLRTLRPATPHADYDKWIAAERLGLSARAYGLIGDESAAASLLWGASNNLDQVPQFLKKARVSFEEMLELIDAEVFFSNPTPPALPAPLITLVRDQEDPCNTDLMTLSGVTAHLPLISRLLRLRAALGWSIRETEQLVHNVGESPVALDNDLLLKIARLEDVRSRLRLAPLEAAALYGDMSRHKGVLGLLERSFFGEVFLRKIVADPDTAVFTAVDDGATVTAKLNDHEPAILASLSLTSAEFRLLVAPEAAPELDPETDDSHSLKVAWPVNTLSLSLPSLSRLYRIATFARAAGLSIRDYLVLHAYSKKHVLAGDVDTTVGPIGSASVPGSPDDAVAFLEIVDIVRRLNVDVAELDFYLRDFSTEPSNLRPSKEEVEHWDAELMAGVEQAMKAAEAVTDDDDGTVSKRLLAVLFPPSTPPQPTDTLTKIVTVVEGTTPPAPPAPETDLDPLGDYVQDLAETKDRINAVDGLADIRDRYTYLAQQLTRYVDSLNFVVQWLSARFQIEPAIVRHIGLVSLSRTNEYEHEQAAIRAFLPDLDPGEPPQPPPAPPPASPPPPFEASKEERVTLLRHFQKAAGLLRQLGVTAQETTVLFPSPDFGGNVLPYFHLASLPVTESGPSLRLEADSDSRERFELWLRIAHLLELRKVWKAGTKTILSVFAEAAAPGASLGDVQALIAEGMGWRLDDVAALCSHFDLTDPVDFRSELPLLQLHAALNPIQRMGVSASEAETWTRLDGSVETVHLGTGTIEDETLPDASPVRIARAIRRIARARNGSGWTDIIRPLRDRLREKQRDALVEYLLHRKNLSESRELFHDLLIDVDMSPVMLSSRIVHAAGAIQVFVQRSLLRHYEGFEIEEDGAHEWQAMRNYRVWEANRKIFLYPENWIEPDLRDDKTPLYEAFERQLRQGPVTHERAEEAYRAYLEGLEDLSGLDVRAVYVEPGLDGAPATYHVFARTRANKYYHRTHTRGRWLPWEKLDLDIEGEHLMPIAFQGSLYLFWPTFQDIPYPAEPPPSGPQNLNTRLGFRYSERRHGRWAAAADIGLTKDLGATPQRFALSFQASWENDYIVIDCVGYVALGATEPFEATGTSQPFLFLTFNPNRPNSARVAGEVPLFPYSVPFFYAPAGSTMYVGEPPNTIKSEQDFIRREGDSSSSLELYPMSEAWGSELVLTNVPLGFRLMVPRDREPSFVRKMLVLQDRSRALVARRFPTPEYEYLYRFERLDHGHLYEFKRALASKGVDGLLRRASQSGTKLQDLGGGDPFNPSYEPTGWADPDSFPKNEVDFELARPMGIYNWELFFHIPFAIAVSLSREGRYDEALRWFHYVFDPTDGSAVTGKSSSFWKFRPFYTNDDLATIQEQLGQFSENAYAQVIDAMTDAAATSAVAEKISAQIDAWRQNPFNPHAIARLRPIAYQKAVFLKYLDTLVAWADQLFTRDTMESVNEAASLYLLAWDLLGPRPNEVPSAPRESKTFADIASGVDELGNYFLQETEAVATAFTTQQSALCPSVSPPLVGSTYFCIPPNELLLGKWDVIQDRLFKIRHGQNIEGIERALPLFAPPIDPAILVQAAAFGIDIQTVLNDLAAGAPAHRFSLLHQKALDFTGFVSSLGSQLLSALEKKDAEHLANLRVAQEIEVHEAVRETKKEQIAAAKEDLAAAQQSRQLAETRRAFYQKAQGNSDLEDASLEAASVAEGLQTSGETVSLEAKIAYAIPDFSQGAAGPVPTQSTETGGSSGGNVIAAFAEGLSFLGRRFEAASKMLATQAEYKRRDEEFALQENLARQEIVQIDKQIAAAQLRVAVAEHELALTEKQLTQARDVRRVMLEKFTKEDLYDWMVGEAAAVYYQAYKLAYDLAKKAERAFQIEIGDTSQSYVRYGHWDSLKKGLLAGEKLALDLRKLDSVYLDKNKRELELTKHVSLGKHAPEELLKLRETGECSLNVTEADYDRDYPTHYLRRLKQVSITLPCTTGPYQGVQGTLSLLKGETRVKPTDDRTALFHNIQSICTSTAQNDAGLHELTFRDERLLPFEGAGAHSESTDQWKFKLTEGNELAYDSISDLVLHVRYTARQGRAAPNNLFGANHPRKRLFRLKSDFADAWASFIEGSAATIDVPMKAGVFASAHAESPDKITSVQIYARVANTDPSKDPQIGTRPGMEFRLPDGPSLVAASADAFVGKLWRYSTGTQSWTFNDASATWQVKPESSVKPELLDVWLIINYSLKQP